MGIGSSTPRRISVRNEEARIIQVSEDVVKRLSSAQTVDASIQTQPQPTRSSYVAPERAVATEAVPPQQPRSIESPSSSSQAFVRQSNVTEAEVVAAERRFKQKLEELEKLAPKKTENRCRDVSAKVAECYATHPKQTLRCAETVREFAQCAYQLPVVSSS